MTSRPVPPSQIRSYKNRKERERYGNIAQMILKIRAELGLTTKNQIPILEKCLEMIQQLQEEKSSLNLELSTLRRQKHEIAAGGHIIPTPPKSVLPVAHQSLGNSTSPPSLPRPLTFDDPPNMMQLTSFQTGPPEQITDGSKGQFWPTVPRPYFGSENIVPGPAEVRGSPAAQGPLPGRFQPQDTGGLAGASAAPERTFRVPPIQFAVGPPRHQEMSVMSQGAQGIGQGLQIQRGEQAQAPHMLSPLYFHAQPTHVLVSGGGLQPSPNYWISSTSNQGQGQTPPGHPAGEMRLLSAPVQKQIGMKGLPVVSPLPSPRPVLSTHGPPTTPSPQQYAFFTQAAQGLQPACRTVPQKILDQRDQGLQGPACPSPQNTRQFIPSLQYPSISFAKKPSPQEMSTFVLPPAPNHQHFSSALHSPKPSPGYVLPAASSMTSFSPGHPQVVHQQSPVQGMMANPAEMSPNGYGKMTPAKTPNNEGWKMQSPSAYPSLQPRHMEPNRIPPEPYPQPSTSCLGRYSLQEAEFHGKVAATPAPKPAPSPYKRPVKAEPIQDGLSAEKQKNLGDYDDEEEEGESLLDPLALSLMENAESEIDMDFLDIMNSTDEGFTSAGSSSIFDSSWTD